jgi:DNA-directed RNA polymerase I, II, and III subunit RPABC2
MYNSNNANSGINVIQQIHKFGMNRSKDDDNGDEGEEDKMVHANTLANTGNEDLEEESDMSSHTGTDTDATDATESVSTGMSDVEDDDDDDIIDDMDGGGENESIETPAMLAKKTATAASASANSDAKKKAVIANKRAIASSKPPKGKATLQDITTLQNSYDDIANDDDDLGESDNGSDEDDDGPNNYLRKFERETHENYIESCHQEMMHLNNAEVAALARVIRNADGVIVDALHKTMPFLTKYEKTRILGQRAKQLNQGAQPMIPVDKKIIDGYLIAQLELQQKALPFIIRRPLPGGKSEYWRLADLEII